MKKLITSIFLLSYFVATCGVVISSHYCMNRLSSIHLFEKAAITCNKCGMATIEINGCCHDEVKVLKLEQDQNNAPFASYTIDQLKVFFSAPSAYFLTSFNNVYKQRHFHNLSPPLLSAKDIYLQNNVFRI